MLVKDSAEKRSVSPASSAHQAKLVDAGLRIVSRPGQQCSAGANGAEGAGGEDRAGNKPHARSQGRAEAPGAGGVVDVPSWLSASAASIACRCWVRRRRNHSPLLFSRECAFLLTYCRRRTEA